MIAVETLRRLRMAAESAALVGGHHLRHRARDWGHAVWKGQHDIKVAADTAVEALILGHLRANSDLPVLSEEAGADAAFGQGPCWLVDPLDGSVNYGRGLPLSAVSIAVWDGWAPILGVVYDFHRDDLYVGVVGEGLMVNHQQWNGTGQGRDILATGIPARADHDAAGAGLSKRAAGYRKVRMLGSAALSLAWTAAGRIDAYGESGIMAWDVAAGLALVQAAGGRISIGQGGSVLDPLDVSATAPEAVP